MTARSKRLICHLFFIVGLIGFLVLRWPDAWRANLWVAILIGVLFIFLPVRVNPRFSKERDAMFCLLLGVLGAAASFLFGWGDSPGLMAASILVMFAAGAGVRWFEHERQAEMAVVEGEG